MSKADITADQEEQRKINANIKSAVAGRPNDSDVLVRSGSLLANPARFNCVALHTGTQYSTAKPRSSSAMPLTISYKPALAFTRLEAHMFK